MTSIFFVQCIIKQLLRSVSVISRTDNQGRGRGYQPKPKAEADNPYRNDMYNNIYLLYIELTISFLIGRKCTVTFRNQRLSCHLAVDFSIIMSRTLKVTGNHVKFARFVLLAVSEEAKT